MLAGPTCLSSRTVIKSRGLPAGKGFVVQFTRETTSQTGTFSGRVEHLSLVGVPASHRQRSWSRFYGRCSTHSVRKETQHNKVLATSRLLQRPAGCRPPSRRCLRHRRFRAGRSDPWDSDGVTHRDGNPNRIANLDCSCHRHCQPNSDGDSRSRLGGGGGCSLATQGRDSHDGLQCGSCALPRAGPNTEIPCP